MKSIKVVRIYLGSNAGNGLKPDNVPSVANEARFDTTIATTYSKNPANIPNTSKSCESALNFNFILLLPFAYIITSTFENVIIFY